MNIPNLVTLSRVPLLIIISLCLIIPFHWGPTLAFGLFVLGAITDWLDGYLARKLSQVSSFGKLMDALVDKIFTLGIMIILLVLMPLPLWLVPVVLLIHIREYLITGLRLIASSKGAVLAAESSGKIKTVVQFIGLSLLLLSLSLRQDFGLEPFDGIPSYIYIGGIVLLVLSCLLAIISGGIYLYKYKHLLKEDEK